MPVKEKALNRKGNLEVRSENMTASDDIYQLVQYQQTVLDSLQDGLVLINAQGHVLFHNAPVSNLLESHGIDIAGQFIGIYLPKVGQLIEANKPLVGRLHEVSPISHHPLEALYPEHAHGMDELLHAADQAMYLAKRSGKNRYRVALSSL